jgi:predicted CoA-binding protein
VTGGPADERVGADRIGRPGSGDAGTGVDPATNPPGAPADLVPETAEERAARRRADRARTIAHLDLEEARGSVPLLGDEGIAAILRTTRRIAVVGASSNEARPSFGVFRYLVAQGYDCVPVNPAERDVLGVSAFPTLRAAADATGPFDLVDVFRRSELVPPHAREAVEIGARCLWLQLGVVSWEAARIAHDGGLVVVMDRCTAIEHRRFRDR